MGNLAKGSPLIKKLIFFVSYLTRAEGHYGVSMLNDCKYGHSVKDSNMALTLIKSGIEPNPVADQEEHYFTYALYPHAGKWQEARTVEQVILSILVYTLFSRMFDRMQPPVVKHSIAVA